jgi:hypothetical protein
LALCCPPASGAPVRSDERLIRREVELEDLLEAGQDLGLTLVVELDLA